MLVVPLLVWLYGVAQPVTVAQAHAEVPRAEAPAPWPPFVARGRLHSERGIDLHVPGDSRDAARLTAALKGAAAAWNAVAPGSFRLAGPDQAPVISVRFVGPDEDPCGVIGRGAGAAHTGPLGVDGFVHVDPEHFVEREGGDAGGRDLGAVLAHELGHVLGLDHAPGAGLLMSRDPRVARPTPADSAGLHALYGGGEDGPGDLVIERASDGRRSAPVLRVAAPAGFTAAALFDTDGDGRLELLVWSMAARPPDVQAGTLVIHHFEHDASADPPGPRLMRTRGPLLEAVAPGALTSWRSAPGGRRWSVTRDAQGEVHLRAFDAQGWLEVPAPAEQLALVLEELLALPAPAVLVDPPGREHGTDGAATDALVGDLDGDGVPERIRRISAARTPAARTAVHRTAATAVSDFPIPPDSSRGHTVAVPSGALAPCPDSC